MLTALLFVLALQEAEPPKPDELALLRARFEEEKGRPASQRISTVSAVATLNTDAAFGFLEEIFDKEKDAELRAHVLTCLSAAGGARAMKKLDAVARDAKVSPYLRAQALDGATRSPTKEGLQLITAVLRDAADRDFKLQAYACLNRYHLVETESLWREALAGSEPLFRGAALVALAPLKDPALVLQAKKALGDPGEDRLVQYGSVAVLKAVPGADTVRHLIQVSVTNDVTLRRLLADALAATADEKTADLVFAAMRDAQPYTRWVAVRSLGKLRHPKAADRLFNDALKDRVPDVRVAALEAIVERGDKKAEETVQREAQRGDDGASLAALALLADFPSDSTWQLLVKLAGSGKPAVAITALDVIGETRKPEGVPVLDRALKSKDWPVRVAAIRALGKIRAAEAVDALVVQIAREEGRLLAECADALRGLTGKPIAYAPGAWKEWWAANREGFKFPEKAEAALAGAGVTTYHGIPIVSTKIVFCLDISGSMSELNGGESRMEQAKKELSRVLSSLGKEVNVNLIFFDDRIDPWQRQLVPIKSNLPRALQLVGSLQPRGRTNIFDALEVAFMHANVDTVCLLSDGEPTDGKFVFPEEVLREVRRLNRTRRIAIHTISFGPSEFMRRLAEQNDGTYVEIR